MNAKPVSTLTGLFANDAKTIAESLGSRDTFPQGPAMGMRVLMFYISHAGRVLSPSRRRNLEKAKEILSAQVRAGALIESTTASAPRASF
jgi:hypothetical protein